MFPLPLAWTLEAGLSLEAGIPRLWDTSMLVIGGTYIDAICSLLTHHGPRETISIAGCCTGQDYLGYVFTLVPMGKSIV